MDEYPQIVVTLSDALLRHLKTEARTKHVPLRYVVAGLVCDLAERRGARTLSDHPVNVNGHLGEGSPVSRSLFQEARVEARERDALALDRHW